jgi:hypothetical protein
MKFNGTPKQNKWAEEILNSAKLSDEQIDNLLRWGGPRLHAAEIMDAIIVIENRDRLGDYATALGIFYQKTPEGKRVLAKEAVEAIQDRAEKLMVN